MNRRFWILAIAILLVSTGAFAADEPTEAAPATPPEVESAQAAKAEDGDCDAPPVTVPAGLFAEPFSTFALAADREGGPNTRGTYTANCHNGTSVVCSGTWGWGRDSNCSSNYTGRCYGNSTGYKFCPTCPTQNCTYTATCNFGGSVACTTSCGNGWAINGCYAYCGDTYHWCPGVDESTCPV